MASWTLDRAYTGDAANYLSMAFDTSGYPHFVTVGTGGTAAYYVYWDGAAWQNESVDTLTVGVMYPVLLLDSGDVPHIVYSQSTTARTKYVNRVGGTWSAVETIDNTYGYTGQTSAVIDSSDDIHVAYYASLTIYKDLRYVVGSSGSWAAEAVDTTGDVGVCPSIALASDGTVHIAYCQGDGSQYLKHAYGTAGAFTVEIADSTTTGILGTSIALDSGGYPHIGYFYTDTVMYVKETAAGWQTPTTVVSSNAGGHQRVALDYADRPYIVYDLTDGTLRFASYTGTWATEVVDDTAGEHVGHYPRIHLDNSTGYVYIGHHDFTNKDIKYAYAYVFVPICQPLMKRATTVPYSRQWHPRMKY